VVGQRPRRAHRCGQQQELRLGLQSGASHWRVRIAALALIPTGVGRSSTIPHVGPSLIVGLVLSAASGLEEPFPLETVTLRTEGGAFYVEGRQTIPTNAKITSLRRITIRGRGEGAVLEVAGKLELKAVTGGEVKVENCWIEVAPECRDLYLSHVTFGSRAGLRTAEEQPADTDIFMEFVKFGSEPLQLTMTAGSVDLQSCDFRKPVTIRGVKPSEKGANGLKLVIMGSTGRNAALAGGLLVTGVKEALVRTNDIGGALTLFRDCRSVTFDGNNARSGTTEFHQSAYGRFGRTTIKNVDVRSDKLVLFSPAQGKQAERVILEHCWFGGLEDPEAIRASIVEDCGQNPESGVLCTFKKTSASPLGFGGGGR
jgi:hypothetical protein